MANVAGNGLANRVVAEVALLFITSIALAIILCVTIGFGSLYFVSITSIGNLVGSIDGFEFFLFKA